jgi:hypothetical protein
MSSEGLKMKTIALLVAAASLVLVVGCGSDTGDGTNPVHKDQTAADKSPSTDLAQVSGGGDAVISAPASGLSDNPAGGGTAGGANPGARPHTQQ